jgi:malonyl CoA-acyl carrier protein transacylase
VCCAHGTTLTELPEDFFWRVVRRPMRFQESLQQLEGQGAHRYIDLGPSGTLATFVKYGLAKSSSSTAHALLTPFGQDCRNLEAVLELAVLER